MRELVDAAGTLHPRASADARIVSLVPSITELLFSLGLGALVVGRTGFCIHPRAAVRTVPTVGGTKDVKLDALRALQPTHVIVNIDENELPTVESIRGFVAHVIVTHPNAPQDNLALFRLLGGIFNADAEAQRLCDEFQRELDACAAQTWPTQSVLYLIWKDPWMTVAQDTYIARTLALVGWHVQQAAGGWSGAARYPQVDLATAVTETDRVLLSSEPFMFREPHVAALHSQFPDKRIDLIDGEMTSWYGRRAIEGLRYLRRFRTRSL